MDQTTSELKPKTGLVERLRQRLSTRTDTEYEQSKLRLYIGLTILVFLLITFSIENGLDTEELNTVIFFCGFIALSLAMVGHITFHPAANPLRRRLGAVLDHGATTIFMILAGASGAFWWGVYLWVTLGNGFRYGKSYLHFSQILSIVGFTIVLSISNYWTGLHGLGLGLIAALFGIPLYCAKLIERLTDAISRAEEANAAKSRFVANMSHELRTPLNAIVGIGDLLVTTPLTGEQKRWVDALRYSAGVLMEHINDVLDFSKIEAGKLTIEQIALDLPVLINSTVKMFRPQAQSKGLQLSSHLDPEAPLGLQGDPHKITHVLINLIGNAIKFTEHGEVSINARLLYANANTCRLRFEVRDTGIGIPLEAQTRIFNIFTQADESTTRKFGGTGLGTTIAKRLVEAMGGAIGLESIPGKGTTFWFDLDLARQSPEIQQPVNPEGAKVLLVGFDPSERSQIKTFLSGWGVQTDYADNAPAVVIAATAAKNTNSHDKAPNLLLIKVQDAGQGSAESAAAVQLIWPDSALVAVTAKLDALDRERFLAAGYGEVLQAPIDKAQLFNALHASVPGEAAAPRFIATLTDNYQASALPAPQLPYQLHVLVADDNNINQMVIAEMLKRAGHRVTVVGNGEQALDALEQEHYDVAILDMHMPVMGGIEAYKIYRVTAPQDTNTKFIMLSANTGEDAIRECKRVGFDAFLPKPVNTNVLLDTLTRLPAGGNGRVQHREPQASNTQPADQAPLLLDYQKLDELRALALTSGFLKRVVNGFINEGQTCLGTMREALAAKHYQQFKDAAHAMKGSARSIGAYPLGERAQRAEQATHSELQKEGAVLMAEIEQSFSATSSALNTRLEELKEAGH